MLKSSFWVPVDCRTPKFSLGGGGYHHVGGIGDFEVGSAVGLDQGDALTFFDRLHVAGIGLLLYHRPRPVLG